ncbi:Protein of unknown function [Pyronema omphalodes CBS 100304]|uniref:Secreted protein n=1 Tax=Pyronema omphalodes (strain CBS 100304) TaxID=1076935 RepID=U4LJL7_PYROM|nr:Protein of unknown function [Pyronema omphalodes CBS 100304]
MYSSNYVLTISLWLFLTAFTGQSLRDRVIFLADLLYPFSNSEGGPIMSHFARLSLRTTLHAAGVYAGKLSATPPSG